MAEFNEKYQKVKDLTEKEEYKKALDEVNNILKENKVDDFAFYLRGNIYKKQGNWQEAINNYTEAITLNPQSPATTMRRICIDILNFFNHDMFNH